EGADEGRLHRAVVVACRVRRGRVRGRQLRHAVLCFAQRRVPRVSPVSLPPGGMTTPPGVARPAGHFEETRAAVPHRTRYFRPKTLRGSLGAGESVFSYAAR